MSAPNIKALALIQGKTSAQAVTTTAADLVVNALGSSKCLKVNALYASNTTASDLKVSVIFKRGSILVYLTRNVVVPTEASFDILRKHVYLEEGDALQVVASAVGMDAIASYEELA